jgi:staphylococcal nuclease domain-containing protein 1
MDVQEEEAFKEERISKVVVSEVDVDGRFFYQDLDQVRELEALMDKISMHADELDGGDAYKPRIGEFVTAKFSDGNWYRAKVRKITGDEYNVIYIDYGNTQDVKVDKIRKTLDGVSTTGKAHEATLAFIKVADGEYADGAYDVLKEVMENREFTAIKVGTKGGVGSVVLYDSRKLGTECKIEDALRKSVNYEIVQAGYATIDKSVLVKVGEERRVRLEQMRKGAKGDDKSGWSLLADALDQAKSKRSGMFRFGEVDDDDY